MGCIPGWGGTQRLPRLAGVEEAIDRIISGTSYTIDDPAPTDLVNASVASDELIATAEHWLKLGDWRALREIKRSPAPAEMLPSAKSLAKTRNAIDHLDAAMKPAAVEALNVILEGSLCDLAAGLRLETAAFLRLVGTPSSRQLIAEFFAKRKC